MVATSRKSHACSTPDSQPEVSATAPAPEGEPQLTTLREVYDFLVGRTELRAEIINGRLTVSPSPTPEHQRAAFRLGTALIPVSSERGLEIFPAIDICTDGAREIYAPDLVLCPPEAPRWGGREIFTSGVILAGEIVSRTSSGDDNAHKPDVYAIAGIPLYLIVDPIADPPAVTILSEPKRGRYTVCTTVRIGKEIHIPAPVDFLLDTAVFL